MPEEYLPALLNIVHAFRESVSLKTAEDSLRQGWQEAVYGDTHPVTNLHEWDDSSGDTLCFDTEVANG